MPAAYRPASIRDERYPTRWDADSATLVIDEEYEDSDGNNYTVASKLPRGSTPTCCGRRTTRCRTPWKRRTSTSRSAFPSSVEQLADDITADQATPFDRALALQDHLRSDEFTYDQNIPGGGGTTAIERFLFTTKAGFCQQFAGSFAAMARARSASRPGWRSASPPARSAPSEPGAVPRQRLPRPHLARGVPGPVRLGAVRADPRPGHSRRVSYTGVEESQAIPGDPSTATTARPSGVDDPFEGEVSDTSLPVETPEGGDGGEGRSHRRRRSGRRCATGPSGCW